VARVLFHCTHGQDDPERAIVPFIAANVAAASGPDVLVVLTMEGAWLGRYRRLSEDYEFLTATSEAVIAWR
jgi:predicted peroxiredoxin